MEAHIEIMSVVLWVSKAEICLKVDHSKLPDYKLNILIILLMLKMAQGPYSTFLIIFIVNGLTQITNGYNLDACYIKSSDSNSMICQRTPPSPLPCDGTDISVTAMTMYVVGCCNSILQCGSAVDCCSIYDNETTPVPDSIKHLYTCTTEQCLGISVQVLSRTGEYYQVLRTTYSCDSKTTQYSTPSTRIYLTNQTTTVNGLTQITNGHTLDACYIKSSDSNSMICQGTPPSPLPCDGTDISVTALTMYIVRRCNSILQCGSAIDCCSIYTNETTPVLNSIKHLNSCTTEQCLRISLQELPTTGEYYQVLRTAYLCDSKTAQYSTPSTRISLTSQTTANEKYVGPTGRSTTTSPDTNSKTNSTDKHSDSVTENHDSGILTASYVSIPIVIVLIAVVIGFVWRRRAKIGHQNTTDNGQSLPDNEYYNMKYHGQAPEQRACAQSSSNQMNISDMTVNKARGQTEETRSYHLDPDANVATQMCFSMKYWIV